MMLDQILELAIGNGLWAVLFVVLFWYQLKDSAKREKKYVAIINTLAVDLAIIKKVDTELSIVSSNVVSIRKFLTKKGGNGNEIQS